MKKKAWTTTEIKKLREGILPTGRSYHAIQQFCCRNKISFPGKRQQSYRIYNRNLKCNSCGIEIKKTTTFSGKILCPDCKIKTEFAKTFLKEFSKGNNHGNAQELRRNHR